MAFFRQCESLTMRRACSQIPGAMSALFEFENTAIEAIQHVSKPELRRRIMYIGISRCVRVSAQALIDRTLGSGEGVERTAICNLMGSAIWRDIETLRFQHKSPGLWRVVQARANEERMSLGKKWRVIDRMARRNQVAIDRWQKADYIELGEIIYMAFLGCGMLAQHKHPTLDGKWIARLSEAAIKAIGARIDDMALKAPMRMPMIKPPVEWSQECIGGYHSKLGQATFRISSEPGADVRDTIAANIKPEALEAINAMQATPLRVCKPVLDALIAIAKAGHIDLLAGEKLRSEPTRPSELEIEPSRRTKAQQYVCDTWKLEKRDYIAHVARMTAFRIRASKVLRAAVESRDYEAIYQPWHFDLTGRMYPASAGVCTMGSDFQQGVLEFSRGEPLDTPDAVAYYKRMLAAHWGADDGSNAEMEVWADENWHMIEAIADDPLGNIMTLAEADAPVQFLRHAIEYVAWRRNPVGFLSHAPIHMDGKCNGIQHLAAMSRSTELAKHVNIIAGDGRGDIYKTTAAETVRRIEDPNREKPAHGFARAMASHGEIKRSLCKHTAMTIPYGSTVISTLDNVRDKLKRERPDWLDIRHVNEAATQAGLEIWDAAQEVLQDAFKTMDAMRQIAKHFRAQTPRNKLFVMMMPDGFPTVLRNIDWYTMPAALGHELEKDERQNTDRKFLSSFGPNLIHAYDATHMRMTVRAALAEGISDTWMIHDSFGCHARFAPRLGEVVREQFARLHGELRPFERLIEEVSQEIGLDYSFGQYNPSEIIDATYSFR